MAKWLAKEFDWDTGRYTGRYYDIAEAGIVAVFVDSFYGDDTAAGTAAAPFKTLGKAITTLNSTGANGSRIFMNGIFSETLPAQTYWYEFIGCGGGRNGRTLWSYNNVTEDLPQLKAGSRYHNLSTVNYQVFTESGGTALPAARFLLDNQNNVRVVNCYFKNAHFTHTAGISPGLIFYTYNTIYNNCFFTRTTSGFCRYNFYGNENVFFQCEREANSGTQIYIYFSNSHVVGFLNTGTYTDNGTNNVFQTEAQYINPTQNDFNVRITSPLIGAGSVDEITGIAANVGGVEVGLPYNGISPEFTTEGGATITDLTIDADGKVTITAPATTGTLESATMDLGNIYPIERIDLFNVFDYLSGEITQGVFETFVTPRMTLTIKLKYGLTEAEVTACPWLVVEYGKKPTYSGTGAIRIGNNDGSFDDANEQEITCRYMKLFVTLQDNS